MAFGPIMKLTTEKGDHIELAPFSREETAQFLPAFQQSSYTRYLHTDIAQTIETEFEWYNKIIHADDSRVWGIWIGEASGRKLIGNTVIEKIEGRNMPRGTTGIVITDKTYWGRGIASAAHQARTLYAFERLGLVRLISYVYEGNGGSLSALEKVGYTLHHVTRNELYNQGKWQAVNVLECLNPADWAWRQWWGNDRPPLKNLEARKRTEAALAWAHKNVVLD